MLNPFNWYGPAFLQLYVALLLLASLVSLTVSRLLRSPGEGMARLDAEQFAYLAGGRTRFVDTLVARLMARDVLDLDRKGRFFVAGAGGGFSPAERMLLDKADGASWRDLRGSLWNAAAAVQRGLVDARLLLDADARGRLRFWQAAPYLVLLGFGTIKWVVGEVRDRPIGYLSLLLLLTALLALVRAIFIDRCTQGGRATLEAARESAERLRRAPVAREADLAVALFGTVVLVGSPWADYHRVRTETAGNSGSSSDGDSGGGDGGGCGGGGCGGCGGD